MNRSGGGMLALALLVAVWAGGGGIHSEQPTQTESAKPAVQQAPSANKQPNKKEPSSSGSREAHPVGDGFLDESELLRETIDDATLTALPKTEQERLNKIFAAASLESGTVGFMIALAPNPVRTHLSLIFDRTVDSLEQALQDSGFDFDRALLPWDNRDHPESDNYLLRAGEDDYRRHAETIPGILIFRRHEDAGSEASDKGDCKKARNQRFERLIVFVVDDMPTSGIDRTQFQVALAIGKRLNNGGKPADLLIMGPTFSGSLRSLQELLKSRVEGYGRATIVSGTITGEESVTVFKQAFASTTPGHVVNFASFQENDKSVLNHLYRYACSQWKLKPSEIAVISETETAYGRREAKVVPRKTCPAYSADDDETRTPLTLHFPRGIYHIRTAYERQYPGGTSGDDATKRARAILRPNLEESRASADTIPDFSMQSPVSQEAVLMGVTDELHKRQSKLVVVMASDSLDTLFLVRYLRKNFAFGQLVILSPDLLLRHESDEPAMRGILTLSPYSLRPGEEADVIHSSTSRREGIMFPDDGEKGVYNATTVLAACLQDPAMPWCGRGMDAKPETSTLPAAVRLEDYGPSHLEPGNQGGSEACCRAQIHLDTLGRDGYWPVAVVPAGPDSWLPLQDREERSDGDANAKQWQASLPMTWKAVAAALLGCFAIMLVCLERASLLGSFEPELLLAPAGLELRGSHGLKRIYLITFLCMSWTGLLALVLWPLGAPEFRANHIVFFIALTAILLYAWFISVLSRRFKRLLWPVHLLTLAILFGSHSLFGREGFRVFVLKYVNLGSQISPLLPLLLVTLSFAWWAWHNISGSVLTDLRRPLLPRATPVTPGAEPALPAMLIPISAEQQRRLERVMGPAFPDRRIWIVIVAVVAIVLFLIFPNRPVRSAEHFAYDYLMIGLLLFSFVLLLESTLRGLMVWVDARQLLRSIDSQPFSKMIARQDGFSWTSIWKIGTGAVDSAHRLVLAEMDTLRVIQTKLPHEWPTRELFPEADAAKVWGIYLALLGQRRSEGTTPPPPLSGSGTPLDPSEISEDRLLSAFQTLQQKLAEAAGVLLTRLQRQDQEHPAHRCESDGETMKKLRAKPLETFDELAEHYVSLVYINYIITILLRIRTLAMAAVGIFVLDVLALSSYPFEPRAILRAFMFTVFVALTICFGVVYAQMHRDRTLSRITDTTPEELGADFWFRMLGVTGIPILSLVATEFPSVGNFLFSWIEPAMKALR